MLSWEALSWILKHLYLILQNALIHFTLKLVQDAGCWTTSLIEESLFTLVIAPKGALSRLIFRSLTISLGAARRAVDASDHSGHSGQAHSLIVVYTLRNFFTGHSDHSIDFWEYSSKTQWPLHFLVHEDATNTQITTSQHPSTSFDALCSKSTTSCLDTWRTSFSHPLYQGRHFLSLKGGNHKPLQPSYTKGGSWLPFIGKSVKLCARATWAILNYTPIGGFRQCFFPAECTQCSDFFSDVESLGSQWENVLGTFVILEKDQW